MARQSITPLRTASHTPALFPQYQSTRIRIALLPPFQPAKYVLALPDELHTIKDLKRYLVQSLSAVQAVVNHGRELCLEIDGFELLAGSWIGVLREDDVIG